jgi:hypothetical protein
MKRIDQLLGRNPFSIDETACYVAAQIIKPFRGDQTTAPWAKLKIGERFLFKLAFIAICHQINWDFLQSRMALHLLQNDGNDILEILRSVTAKEITTWLDGYSKPERIRAAERAGLLRDIAHVIANDFGGEPLAIYQRSAEKIDGRDGFITQLDHFQAFKEDPLKKKSNVLLQELTRERTLRFKDENSIRPAIDYHILRLYLRTGRVITSDIEIQERLKGAPDSRPRLVHLLREKVGEALDLTAFYSNLPVSEVNYIEWQIGRAICKIDAPACVTLLRDPELDESVALLFDGACPYLNTCETCRAPDWRELKEPALKKSFY